MDSSKQKKTKEIKTENNNKSKIQNKKKDYRFRSKIIQSTRKRKRLSYISYT